MPGFLLEARLMRCSFDGLENYFNLQGLNYHLLITIEREGMERSHRTEDGK